MYLTQNFTLNEMIKSDIAIRRGINNMPPERIIPNIQLLCAEVLQPIRNYFNAPIKVNSGYRSPDVNVAVGGSRNSDHCLGMAADIEITGLPNYDLANFIAENLQFTQLILEFYIPGIPDSGWVHVSYNPSNLKMESLTAMRINGKVVYELGLRAPNTLL